MNEKTIKILLATYNGEKYIKAQLESLINNSYKNIEIIISDDGSTDNTLKIIDSYTKQYNFIKLIHNKNKHGAFFNFSNLIRYVKEHKKSDYYMFSDQDDIWLENKIQTSLDAILNFNDELPLLIYTSKKYVTEDLKEISFAIKKEHLIDLNIIHQNKAFGCTFIFNNKLLEKLELEPDSKFINYDHYVVIQAFLYGNIYYLPEKTILYRQHGDNVSGVVQKKLVEKINIGKKYKNNIILYKHLISYMYLNKNYLDKKNQKKIEILHKHLKNNFSLFVTTFLLRIIKNHWLGTLQFYYAILFCK